MRAPSLATRRRRAGEMGGTGSDRRETSPEIAAPALRLPLQEVLVHDPVEWASDTDVEAMAA